MDYWRWGHQRLCLLALFQIFGCRLSGWLSQGPQLWFDGAHRPCHLLFRRFPLRLLVSRWPARSGRWRGRFGYSLVLPTEKNRCQRWRAPLMGHCSGFRSLHYYLLRVSSSWRDHTYDESEWCRWWDTNEAARHCHLLSARFSCNGHPALSLGADRWRSQTALWLPEPYLDGFWSRLTSF